MDTHHSDILNTALTTYCIWLNLWMKADDISKHRYSPNQFTTHDPDNKLWGSYNLVAIIPMYHDLYIFEVTDGDEGGPTELYVFWNGEGIEHLLQGFDTNVQSIYDREKGYLHTPQG